MNFGIVASFTVEAFPLARDLWSGQKVVSGEDIETMLSLNYEMVTKILDTDPDLAVMLGLACISKDGTCFTSVAAQHAMHNSSEHWPASLKAYEEMEVRSHVTRMFVGSPSNSTELYQGSSHFGEHRTIFGTMSYEPSVELELRMAKILCEEVKPVRDLAGFKHGTVIHPFTSNMLASMRKNGGNAFQSLATHRGSLMILNTVWQWDQKADDEEAYNSYYRLMSRLEETAQELAVWHPFKYINYAEATQDVWTGYGDIAELRKLQRDVDPDGVFAKGGLGGGVFKLNEKPGTNAEPVHKYKTEL
jgi:FAD/FMN-containing dehydrogenase